MGSDQKIRGECPRCEHLEIYYEASLGNKYYCEKCWLPVILMPWGLESLDKTDKFKK